MFRRNGKGPLDKEPPSSLFKEETPVATPYKYGAKKGELPPVDHTSNPNYEEQMSFEESMKTSTKSTTVAHPFSAMIKEEVPETTLGDGVIFRGELSFERLLRIDGTFEGELLSQGKVIVGPKGKVKANLNLREAIIEGRVEGNITVQERLELRGDATVLGDIRAKALSVDEGVTILGHVRVNPREENLSLTPL